MIAHIQDNFLTDETCFNLINFFKKNKKLQKDFRDTSVIKITDIDEFQDLLANINNYFSKTEVEIDDSYIQGYVIRGQVRTYFLAVNLDHGNSYCRVYSYPDMQYLCVVDKGVDQSINIDKIVQRIYALHNDSLVAEEVSTL